MHEFKRVHLKWNTLILLIGLILCQIFVYIYNETTFESVSEIRERIAQTKEAIEKNDYEMMSYQTEYFNEYAIYCETIVKNAERMLGNVEAGSYSQQNIIKTVEDFKDTADIKLTYGIDERIISFTNFGITDYLILAFLVYIIVRYFEGRRTGLEMVVRAGAKGRFGLTISRMVILAADSVAVTGIFYFVQYLLTSFLYGFEDDRLIQSVSVFKECNIVMTEGQFFIVYALMKAIALLTFAMLIWFIMHIFQSMMVSVAALAVIFACQYIIYDKIQYTSHYVTAKFINLFSWLDVKNLFAKYFNIDIFGIPVGIRELFFLSIIIIGSLAFIIVLREVFCYGKIELTFIKRIYTKLLTFIDRHRRQGFIFTWELKKVLIKGRGIIVLIIVMIIAKDYIVDTDLQLSYGGSLKSDYYIKYGYDVSEEMYNDISSAKNEYNKAVEEYEEAVKEYDADKINRADLLAYETKLSEKSQRQEFFLQVEQDIAYVEGMRENGKNAMLITRDSYDYLFAKNNHIVDLRKMIIVLLAAIFLLGGIFTADRQTGAMNLIKAAGKGRKTLFYSKIGTGILLVTLCSAAMFFVEFYNIWKIYGFVGLECPAYSFYLFEKLPFGISMGAFILLWYVCRWLVIMSVCMIIMCISGMAKSATASMWISIGLLAIPAFLTYMDVPIIKYISVLEPMWLMKVWLENGLNNVLAYIPMLVIWILGIASYIICRKQYRYKSI